MIFFAISIFLSAFLLFQVQPMIGKFILPWFGGAPAVWSSTMLFFQIGLTSAYAYVHWLSKRPMKQQRYLHIGLVIICALLLIFWANQWPSPITPSLSFRPEAGDNPAWQVLLILSISVGLPYFVLASNGPLMQAWFSQRYPNQSYAKLYALSNIGSVLGLLSYPVLIEPSFSLPQQGWFWSFGLGLFMILLGKIILQQKNHPATLHSEHPSSPPDISQILLWITLAAIASMLLLSVTNQICQEVAVIPFLWVLPLLLYLLSFILSFSGDRAYHRKAYLALFAASLGGILWLLFNITQVDIAIQLGLYSCLMFSGFMLCHGELYHLRPSSNHLTQYYLMISIGGALGGLYVSLIAPYIFVGYWEFLIAMALCLALWLILVRQQQLHPKKTVRFLASILVLLSLGLTLIGQAGDIKFAERNFFGVIRVREILTTNNQPALAMSHGITIHGIQLQSAQHQNTATSYYTPDSGIGLLLRNHPRPNSTLRVGVLGLGIGTLASYAHTGDYYRMYEINPTVIQLAQGQGGFFSFLTNSTAKIDTVLGDARIALEQELSQGQPQKFDVLVLDTFSSDAIPLHLVTAEAFALYLKHLAPDGYIAAHISNAHIDLKPVFQALAQHHKLYINHISNNGTTLGGQASDWLLLSTQAQLPPNVQQYTKPISRQTYFSLWTDSYSNLWQLLKQ